MSKLVTLSIDLPDGEYRIFDPLHQGPVIIEVRDNKSKVSKQDLLVVLKTYPQGHAVRAPELPNTGSAKLTVQEK